MIYLISAILIVSVLGSAMLNLISTSTLGQVSSNHMDRAYFMAEAGGNYALVLVKNDIYSDGTYDDTYAIHNQTFVLDNGGPSEDGRFQILVDDTDPDVALVTSIGKIDVGVSTDVEVQVTYQLAKTPPGQALFDGPIFSDTQLTIKMDTHVEGNVGTNGPVIVTEAGVTITGSEETSVGRVLDSIPFSCGTCSQNKSINNKTWTSTSKEFLNLTVNNGRILTIKGDVVVHVKETFILGTASIIRLFEGASLTLYVDQNAEFRSNSTVEFNGSPNRPGDFLVVGTANANAITIENNAIFVGGIYAPGAIMDILDTSAIKGALIGDEITIEPDGNIVWDPDVGYVSAPADGIGSRVILPTFSDPVQYFSN